MPHTGNSSLVGRSSCPRCRAQGQDRHGDNLALYTDGHSWCFACGYFLPGDKGIEYVKSKISSGYTYSRHCNHLPIDVRSAEIDGEGRDWLLTYGLTLEEIADNFLWSESDKQLIFAVVDDNQVQMWNARNFEANRKKYHTEGYPEDTMVILGSGEPLVIVEDAVSAVKVSRQFTAMPLFCGHVSDKRLQRIKVCGFHNVAIWLDNDKAKAALKTTARAIEMGLTARTVVTPKDPKAYTDQEINVYLTG